MKIRTAGKALAASAAAVGVGVGIAATPASALSAGETNEFLSKLTATYSPTGDANPYDFDIVTRAAIATGADATLASLDKFTLFAPNDRAFEVTANNLGLLGPNHKYGATVDEDRVFNVILNKLGPAGVTKVLLYHVVPGAKVTGKAVLSGPTFQRLTMANNQRLGVTVLSRSASFPVIVLGDKDGRWFNDQVVKSKIDVIKTENTVTHGISDVLLPTL